MNPLIFCEYLLLVLFLFGSSRQYWCYLTPPWLHWDRRCKTCLLILLHAVQRKKIKICLHDVLHIESSSWLLSGHFSEEGLRRGCLTAAQEEGRGGGGGDGDQSKLEELESNLRKRCAVKPPRSAEKITENPRKPASVHGAKTIKQ